MRKDEEEAQEAVCAKIYEETGKKPSVIEEPNGPNTFPDYIIKGINGDINLEITNSGMGFCEKNDNIQERTNVDIAPIEEIFYEEYIYEECKEPGEWILPDQALIITIKSAFPEYNQRKIIKKLLKMLKKQKKHIPISNIKNHPSIGDFSFLTNDNEISHVEIGVTLYEDCPPGYYPIHVLKGSGLASNNPAVQNNLTTQAIVILQNVLKKKEDKSKDIEGKIWLAIINNHPILDVKNYKEAILYIPAREKINFSRILIINNNEAFTILECILRA